MNGPSLISTVIVFAGIALTAYYTVLRTKASACPKGRKLMGLFGVLAAGAVTGSLFDFIPSFSVIPMLGLFFAAIWVSFGWKAKKNLTLTLISCALGYLLFYVSWFVFVNLLYLNEMAIAGGYDTWVDAKIHVLRLVTSFRGNIITALFLISLQFCLAFLLTKAGWFKKGFDLLARSGRLEILVFAWVVFFSLRGMYMMSVMTRTDSQAILIICFFMLLLLFFIIFFWLRKEYYSVYRIRLQESELSLLERSLDSKERLLESLRADNERLARMIHRDNKLIPSAVMSLRQSSREEGEKDGSAGSTREAAAGSLEEISAQRSSALAEYDSHVMLPSTGVTELDSVLLYFSDRASSSGVGFSAEGKAPAAGDEGCSFYLSEFIAILADLCEYAILSAKEADGGEVAVRIGQEDGRLFVEVSDNGGKADLRALKRIGKKRGKKKRDKDRKEVGLIPLFVILRQSGAVLTVDEFSARDNEKKQKFTKSLKVTLVR